MKLRYIAIFFVLLQLILFNEANTCPDGTFGSTCSGICHCLDGNQVCDETDGTCMTGVCSMGWTGVPDCQQACPTGTFGLMCEHTCHCPPGDTCDSVNGLCHSEDCRYGWIGPSCQIRLPVYACPPNVTVVSDTSMNVTWRRWSNAFDQGNGPIAFYQLQYSDRDAGSWSTLNTRNENGMTNEYHFLVTGLTQENYYSFRLILAMRVEDKIQMSVPGPMSAYKRAGPQAIAQVISTSPTPDIAQINNQAVSIPAPSDLRLVATTPNSLTIAWQPASSHSNEYINEIRVTMTNSYSTEPTGSDALYTSSSGHLDILNLSPASLYQIEITTVNANNMQRSEPITKGFWTIQDVLPDPPKPTILNITDGLVYLILYPIEDSSKHVSYYEIIAEDLTKVEQKDSSDLEDIISQGRSFEILDYDAAMLSNCSYFMVRRLDSNLVVPDGTLTIIGDNTTTMGIRNGPLASSGIFAIWVSAVSRLANIVDRSFAKADGHVHPGPGIIQSSVGTALGAGAITGIVFAVIFAIILLLVLIYFLWLNWPICEREQTFDLDFSAIANQTRDSIRLALANAAARARRRKESLRSSFSNSATANGIKNAFKRKPSSKNLPFLTSTPIHKQSASNDKHFQSVDQLDFSSTGPEIRLPSRDGQVRISPHKSGKPILVKQLGNFLQQKENSALPLSEEFKQIPSGITESAHIATRPENRVRNRTAKTLAFDKNRIKLQTTADAKSDYINASLVKSHMHKFYIVSQSPMLSTIADFWRMVWERDIDTIIMLLSLDDGETTYEQYWPEKHQGQCTYGDMIVESVLETKTAYYDVRWFRIWERTEEDSEERSIVHFQYKLWTSTGIPHHPIPFLDMIARVDDFKTDGILIHCQNGGGRSGIYVAIDSLLLEAKTTQKVDVLKCVTVLRQERPNMVRTFRQYKFIFDALLEALHFRETRIHAVRFQFTYDNLLSVTNGNLPSLVATEYEAVVANRRQPGLNQSFNWTDYNTFYTPQKPETKTSVVPNLSLFKQSHTDRFMVMYLDSHKQQDNFVITHYPNKIQSVLHFWQMAHTEQCPGIVLITDNTVLHTPYWPAQGAQSEFADVKVRTLRTHMDRSETSYIRDIELRPKSSSPNRSCQGQESEGRCVRQFQFSPWAHAKDAPPLYAMLEFVSSVRRWYYQGHHTNALIVQATQGVSRAALFCVLWAILERVEEEEVVDVYRSVRYARSFTPAACTNVEQYKFLYRAVKEHLKQRMQMSESANSDKTEHAPPRAIRKEHELKKLQIPGADDFYYQENLPYKSPQALYTIPNEPESSTCQSVSQQSNLEYVNLDSMHENPDSTYLKAVDIEPIYDEVWDPEMYRRVLFGDKSIQQYVNVTPKTRQENTQYVDVIPKTRQENTQYVDVKPKTRQENAQYVDVIPKTRHENAQYVDVIPKTRHENGQYVDVKPKTRHENGQYVDVKPKTRHENGQYVDVKPKTRHENGQGMKGVMEFSSTNKNTDQEYVEMIQSKYREASGQRSLQETDHSNSTHQGQSSTLTSPTKTDPTVPETVTPNHVKKHSARKLYLTPDQHYAHYKEPESPNKVPKTWVQVQEGSKYPNNHRDNSRTKPENSYPNARDHQGMNPGTGTDNRRESQHPDASQTSAQTIQRTGQTNNAHAKHKKGPAPQPTTHASNNETIRSTHTLLSNDSNQIDRYPAGPSQGLPQPPTRETIRGFKHPSHKPNSTLCCGQRSHMVAPENWPMKRDEVNPRVSSESGSFHSTYTSQLYPSLHNSGESDDTLTDGREYSMPVQSGQGTSLLEAKEQGTSLLEAKEQGTSLQEVKEQGTSLQEENIESQDMNGSHDRKTMASSTMYGPDSESEADE